MTGGLDLIHEVSRNERLLRESTPWNLESS